MLDVDDVMVGFPDNVPGAAVVRFGPTEIAEAYPLPPDMHLAGFLLRQLNVLPAEEAKRAAALVFGIADKWIGSDTLHEPVSAIQTLFGCKIPTGRDYSLTAVTKPLTRTRFLGTLVERRPHGWVGFKMTKAGFAKTPEAVEPYVFASIGAVYAGAIAAAASTGLLIESAVRAAEDLTGNVVPVKPTTQRTYEMKVADLLHSVAFEVGMLYFEGLTGLVNEAANFVHVRNTVRDRHFDALDYRDQAIAAL